MVQVVKLVGDGALRLVMGGNWWLRVVKSGYGWLLGGNWWLRAVMEWLWGGYGVVTGGYEWLLGVIGGYGWSWGGNL